MSGDYQVQWLCEALLVSRSGYYDWLHRRRAPGPRARENAALCERIRVEFERQRRTYGSPRLARALGMAGNYETFDQKGRALLPLVRIYRPAE